MAKTSGDSTRGVSIYIFARIQDSFTTQGHQTPTQGFPAKWPPNRPSEGAFAQVHLRVKRPAALA
jgi:hypothetical protein